ncbi:hypothetical protein ACQ4PT_045982 [Festuca glaucescens]
MASTTTSQPSQWADLLPELLGRVIARLPFPDDLARLRAVCRPWNSVVREHACPEVPWIIHSDGTFVTTYDQAFHRRVPFPNDTRFIGANSSWLALYRADANDGRRTYFLHNPFTKTTVPLLGLDAVIGKVSDCFKIRKVLMRSDQDDIVVVMTNHSSYPIILCRPGKPGAWSPPKQLETLFASISDVAFHKGAFFGITNDKKLFMLVLDEDDDGTPDVTYVGCLIKDMPGDDQVGKEDADEDYGEALGNEYEQESEYSDASSFVEEDEDVEEETSTTRHLIESDGRLLMLRRQERILHSSDSCTSDVEVLEVDFDVCELVSTDVTGTLYSCEGAGPLYMKPMVNFDKLCEIYASDLAKGGSARGPGEQEVAEDDSHVHAPPTSQLAEENAAQARDNTNPPCGSRQGRKITYPDDDAIESGILT